MLPVIGLSMRKMKMNANECRRCKPCALKWVIKNRRRSPRRLTVPAIKSYIAWIKDTFSKDKPKQVEYGIILACTLMTNFIESKKAKE